MKVKKLSLRQILALGAMSTALLGGALMESQQNVDAASSTTFLRVTHNAYEYNRSGKRANKRVDTKGSSFYAKVIRLRLRVRSTTA